MPMPKMDLLFIAALLQNTEVYAEAACLSLSKTDREHVAGMLDLLRRHYDDRIEGMQKENRADLSDRIENRRQDENRLLDETEKDIINAF